MSTQEERAKLIGSGSAAGLLAFCDFVIAKGYGTAAAVTPLKSAAKQVFVTVAEGEDKLGGIDVRTLDLDDYMARFANKKRGALKSESLASYGTRVRRAVEVYTAYLEDGRTPHIKSVPGRGKRSGNASPSAINATSSMTAAPPSPVTDMVEYPFPLRSGTLASVRLPKRLERVDAERMAAFIRALVYEPEGELPVDYDDGE